jgi:protein SCO1/2
MAKLKSGPTAGSTKKILPRARLIGIGILTLGLMALGVAFLVRGTGNEAIEANAASDCTGRAFSEIGGPFSLIDQSGKAVTEKTYLGRPAFIYFGFTYCPDICPLSLQTMKLALDQAGPKASKIQPILISVDPERDTPEKLATYVTSNGFPKGLVGLTGSAEQVASAAKAFKVGFRKADGSANSKDYMIDHTSILYLLDSKGKLSTFFTSDNDPAAIGKCLGSLLASGL